VLELSKPKSDFIMLAVAFFSGASVPDSSYGFMWNVILWNE